MDELRAGDIVVYEHTAYGTPKRNGLVGIVRSGERYYGAFDSIHVDWLLINLSAEIECARPYIHNLRKLGHIDDWEVLK